jgi:hypothetical protein
MTVNRNILIALGKQFDLRDFVETGTNAGGTFRTVRDSFDRAFTIDLTENASDFVESEKFFFFRGSSGERLGEIIQTHKIERALFLLDAHMNQTFYVDDGNNQVPKELEAIALYAPTSLIVIDDITKHKGKYWVNDSYEFTAPEGWQVRYKLPARIAVLHRGGYVLPENL